MVKIAPSILAADFEHLEKEIQDVVYAGADCIHVDVMDGKFVNNETPGIEMYKTAKQYSSIPIDTHLMVENPEVWVDDIILQCDMMQHLNTQHLTSITQSIAEHSMHYSIDDDIITFHVEAVNEMTAYRLIDKIHGAGMKAGIAIKPNTELKDVLPFIPVIDMVLIMTVEPGYGGQTLIESCLKKVKELRELEPSIDIEVDGGINLDNISIIKKNGANVIVAGTAVFKAYDRKAVIDSLRK